MAFALGDRVRETSETLNVGSYILAGAVAGFRTFSSGVGIANHTTYVATMGTQWEVGIGLVATGGSTLDRLHILASTNAGAKVIWTAGTKDIRSDVTAFFATQMYRGSVLWGGTSSGTADAQNITVGSGISPVYDYWPGMTIMFIAGLENDSAMTVNVNQLGARDLRHFDNAVLQLEEIKVGAMHMIVYDGTRFRLLSPYEVI